MKSLYSFVLAVAIIMFAYLFVAADTAFGQVSVVVGNPVVVPQQVVVPQVQYVPQQVMVPVVQPVQYQYQRSVYVQRWTPIRTRWFGRHVYRVQHIYAPVQQ